MLDRQVTLSQLKAFEAVARLGSHTAAARELFITQPAISKKIRMLQEEIGLPLIDQVGRSQYLTEAGQMLLEVCSDWLGVWGRFEQSVADLKGVKRGRLRIAVVTTSGYFMPRLLGPFCAEFPGVDVSMEVLNRDRVLGRLSRNEDDLYVMGLPPDDIEVDCRPLVENPLVVVGSSKHPWTRRTSIPMSWLAKEQFLVRERGSGTRIAMEQRFAEMGVELRVRMVLGSTEAIKQAVAGGLGLAILSRHAINPLSGGRGLVELPVAGFPLRRSWYLVTPQGKRPSVVAQAFLQFIDEHLEMIEP